MTDTKPAGAISDESIAELARVQEQIAKWDPRARAEAMKHLAAMDEVTIQAWYCDRGRSCDGNPHDGYFWQHARGDQWPPVGQDWFVWACLAGRGWGKTRTGAEYTRKMSEKVGRMALIAPTAQDARDTMIEGESGLVAVCERAGMKILYEPAKKRVTFPSGSRATLFSGEEPNRLRGPQHGYAWLDEPAHMPLIDEVWSNLLFGLRLPPRPHILVTTTPTPRKWIRELIAEPDTVPVRGRTHDNLVNLAENYRKIIQGYEGTRLGRQELYGEILEDVVGALWNASMLVYSDLPLEDMNRIVVAIDPAGTANRRSDETGIVTAGLVKSPNGDTAHILRDSSGQMSPRDWAQRAIKDYEQLGADAIVVETNFGADMVRENLRHNGFDGRIIESRATRGKQVRAEPVAALYEQHRVYHREGILEKLEEEMLTWVPGEGASPNRIDAMVWAVTELLKPGGEYAIASPRRISGGLARPVTPNPNPIYNRARPW